MAIPSADGSAFSGKSLEITIRVVLDQNTAPAGVPNAMSRPFGSFAGINTSFLMSWRSGGDGASESALPVRLGD